MQGLWTTPDFSYKSQYNTLDKINLVPPPVQKPHPPIYIAATRTPTTLEFLVSTGHNLCIAVVQDTADALDLCQRFVSMSKAAGHHRPMSEIPFFRYFYVAETAEQVRQDTEARLNWVIDIMQWRRFIPRGSEVYQRMEDWRTTRTELPASYDVLAQHAPSSAPQSSASRKSRRCGSMASSILGAILTLAVWSTKKCCAPWNCSLKR